MFGEDVIYCFLPAVKSQEDLWCFGASGCSAYTTVS